MKETKWFCDICDAELKLDTCFPVEITNASKTITRELDLCKGHYDALLRPDE